MKNQRTNPSKMKENQRTTDPFQMGKINVQPFQNVRKLKYYISFSNEKNQRTNPSKM